jgi:glycosyltransferase involved in cell wall biosynthesis
VLPNVVDRGRVAPSREPRFLTFVNPSCEKGVYPFARIADELGRIRPDIPILVVEGRASERTLVDCGLDLRPRGNVFMMSRTSDPRHFWGVTRIGLLPSLWWENQPLVAIEAMIHGIPVIASDRGGITETLGDAGVVLPLPERLTPFTRELPTAEEVAPWVGAITRLWDDEAWYAEQSRLLRAESRRWDPEVAEPQYVEFFQRIRSAGSP